MANPNSTVSVAIETTAPVDPTSTAVTPFYLDKAFWMVLLGALLPFLNKLLGINLPTEQIAGVLVAILGYVVAHKWKSGTIRAAEIDHQTQVAVATLQATTPKTPAGAADALGKL